jgi:hypothetical protein
MSQLGQTEKNSVRAYVFRFTPGLGHCSIASACLKREGTAPFLVALHLAKHIVPEPERLFIKIKLHASGTG